MKKIAILILALFVLSCTNSKQKQSQADKMENFEKGTYGYDLSFLSKHGKPVELVNGNSRILISAEYQGRVMTSTAGGLDGKSYGWLNYELLESGRVLTQFNPVGGEERFWLGPEGGQYSLFFKPGDTFDFENWATPAPIDTEPFEIDRVSETEAEFSRSMKIPNYSKFTFEFDVDRKISMLKPEEIKEKLGIRFGEGVKNVGYTTINQLTNTGNEAWTKENGLLSIWLLGMFNPSPSVTIFIPFNTKAQTDYIVKDDYFGKIPDDRLVIKDGMIYFKGDGKQRGKLGIPPQRSMSVLGSYDAENKILTVVKTKIPEGETDYVNSAWEIQESPYKGDALNSYNDGPLEEGGQLGPFYELETSSPAIALKPGEKAVYSQSTIHFEGTEEELNAICQQIFDVSLNEVKSVFSE